MSLNFRDTNHNDLFENIIESKDGGKGEAYAQIFSPCVIPAYQLSNFSSLTKITFSDTFDNLNYITLFEVGVKNI